jgi:hypothetical protein
MDHCAARPIKALALVRVPPRNPRLLLKLKLPASIGALAGHGALHVLHVLPVAASGKPDNKRSPGWADEARPADRWNRKQNSPRFHIAIAGCSFGEPSVALGGRRGRGRSAACRRRRRRRRRRSTRGRIRARRIDVDVGLVTATHATTPYEPRDQREQDQHYDGPDPARTTGVAGAWCVGDLNVRHVPPEVDVERSIASAAMDPSTGRATSATNTARFMPPLSRGHPAPSRTTVDFDRLASLSDRP